jgi:hypothetical protein
LKKEIPNFDIILIQVCAYLLLLYYTMSRFTNLSIHDVLGLDKMFNRRLRYKQGRDKKSAELR